MMKLDATVPANLQGFVAGVAADLEFGHQRLKAMLEGLTPEQLEKTPTGLANSIATLVVHIAGTEISFGYRLRGEKVPDELVRTYMLGPHENLNVATGETVESLREKLTQGRTILLETLAQQNNANLDDELPLGGDRTATRRWFLSLLPYHQATHIGQIQMIKKLI